MSEPFACTCGARTLVCVKTATFDDRVVRERRCAWCGERVATEERVWRRGWTGNVERLTGVKRRRMRDTG